MRSVTDFLQADHRRLDGLWEEQEKALRPGNLDQARSFFSEFSSGLRRHIHMEEEILFPAFEERSGMRGVGPTVVMRQEHWEIEALLEEISAALARAQSPADAFKAVRDQAQALKTLLRSHDQKEENVLYPMSDRLLEERERDDLVRKMQAI
jgi:iron-sulfur cluster repair protein YtfE (RIC family)